MFIGEYEHSLDEKKRISLPKAFRASLGKKVVMTRGLDNCLFVYSRSAWEKVAAKLQDPVLPKAHTRFRHLWNWTGGDAEIMSRAVDETGYVQPTRTDLIASRGVSSVGYHYNPITTWQVRGDGAVMFKPESWT